MISAGGVEPKKKKKKGSNNFFLTVTVTSFHTCLFPSLPAKVDMLNDALTKQVYQDLTLGKYKEEQFLGYLICSAFDLCFSFLR
jgi:hypothetical protein